MDRHWMPMTKRLPLRRTRPAWAGVCAAVATALAAGCGGAIDNNPETSGRQELSFPFYQRCVEPILVTPLPIPGTSTLNSCAASGCHDNVNGTGGSLRLRAGATVVPNPGSLPEGQVTSTDMYRNYYSTQGAVAFGAIRSSRLLTKPLVQNTLHGGGLIFESESNPNVQVLLDWMTHPVPTGQSEFSYDPASPAGSCTIP
jgi:hypothetical protein